jgi:hypothetical protein
MAPGEPSPVVEKPGAPADPNLVTTRPMRFHLAWHQSHVASIVIGSLPLLYVLVPEGTDSKLALLELEVIGDSGRPREMLHTNQLQLASPRDPDLTLAGAEPLLCEREKALISNLVGRAKAASYVLPEIIPTGAPPQWSRFTVSTHARRTLWRAGGVL